MVVFENGYIETSVRASVSLPAVFPPIRLGRYLLVDGGVHGNMPAMILQKKGFHKILAINASGTGDPNFSLNMGLKKQGSLWKRLIDYFNLPPIIHIISRCLFIQGHLLARNEAKYCDYILTPNTQSFTLLDFDQLEAIIDSGRKSTLLHLEQIKAALLS